MSSDLTEQLQSAIEWIIRVVSSLGVFLPIAIFVLFNIFSGKDKKKASPAPQDRRQEAPRPAEPRVEPQWETPVPVPAGPFGMFELFNLEPEPTPDQARERTRQRERDDAYRHERDDAYRHDESDALQWGSAFAANDAEKAASAFKWGSAFDEPHEKVKWGWDKNEWGGDYAPRPSSEPTINVG